MQHVLLVALVPIEDAIDAMKALPCASTHTVIEVDPRTLRTMPPGDFVHVYAAPAAETILTRYRSAHSTPN